MSIKRGHVTIRAERRVERFSSLASLNEYDRKTLCMSTCYMERRIRGWHSVLHARLFFHNTSLYQVPLHRERWCSIVACQETQLPVGKHRADAVNRAKSKLHVTIICITIILSMRYLRPTEQSAGTAAKVTRTVGAEGCFRCWRTSNSNFWSLASLLQLLVTIKHWLEFCWTSA